MFANRFNLNPVTIKRLRRFKKRKRAFYSLLLLSVIFLASLGANLICNEKPLYIKHNGKSYFPFCKYYPESEFVPDGAGTRPDYKVINKLPSFSDSDENYMIFAPIPFGPSETIKTSSIRAKGTVTATIIPVPAVGTINISNNLIILRSKSCGQFFKTNDASVTGINLSDIWPLTAELTEAVNARFRNETSEPLKQSLSSMIDPALKAEISLSTFNQRTHTPRTVRLTFRGNQTMSLTPITIAFDSNAHPVGKPPQIWKALSKDNRENIAKHVEACFNGFADTVTISNNGTEMRVRFDNTVVFPYKPLKGHWMGIDSTGRDVLALVIHGLRVSLMFSLLLVLVSMTAGILIGAVQGYYGGVIDITGQRLIEIWSAIPFLYVMILMGSIYGRSFALLLLCYALFRWIGISYYMRAEFLRLRTRPFVDAARTLGIPSRKIILKHVLPNALTPIVTFLPFSLVGAISALAALDYLGFGLPALTPSLGQLLQQAQQFRWAWWLILFPSLALFVVILLGVFIGEGVRDAYDPTPKSRIE